MFKVGDTNPGATEEVPVGIPQLEVMERGHHVVVLLVGAEVAG